MPLRSAAATMSGSPQRDRKDGAEPSGATGRREREQLCRADLRRQVGEERDRGRLDGTASQQSVNGGRDGSADTRRDRFAGRPRGGPHEVAVVLHVNESALRSQLDGCVTLPDALREHLELTGTKKGSDQRACTVLVDGKCVLSCGAGTRRRSGRRGSPGRAPA